MTTSLNYFRNLNVVEICKNLPNDTANDHFNQSEIFNEYKLINLVFHTLKYSLNKNYSF